MADVPAGFRPVRWDDSGLRGRRARIIADPGVYYDLPPDEADVVIVDDEPNIYAELTVALPKPPIGDGHPPQLPRGHHGR